MDFAPSSPPAPTNEPPASPDGRAASTRWLLLAIIVLGMALRFFGLNWDQSAGQHPDERHVTMCTWRLDWPTSFAEYLDEAKSPLNPRNREAHFFAYGTLPSTLLRGVMLLGGVKTPEQMVMTGRVLSALADTIVIALVFALAWTLYRQTRTALFAALLYALAVLPIQHAHFFVVDPFANLFIALGLVLLARAWGSGRWHDYAFTGIALGLAVSCKISVATFVLPVALVALLPTRDTRRPGWRRSLSMAVLRLTWFALAAVITVRLALPDAFGGFWPWQLAPRWVANMREVVAISTGVTDIPFTRQFYGRTPWIWPWWNMVVWGLGSALGLAAWIAWARAGWKIFRRGSFVHIIPVLWTAVVFFHLGCTYQATLRYFLPIYGCLCVLAAWGLDQGLAERAGARWRALLGKGLVFLVVTFTLGWALAFVSIYTKPHTRVEASSWIYDHVPAGSVLACEHWDDWLPLPQGAERSPGLYTQIEFPHYVADDGEKRGLLLARLNQADYIIVASQKLRDSIPRMPHRYPFTIRYYQALEDGSLGFDRVAEFRRDMNFFGVPISTRSAEEAFSVYDHPPVVIYKKSPRYDPEALVRFFNNIPLDGVSDTREPLKEQPRELRPTSRESRETAAGRPESAILLSPERWAEAQAGGTWSRIFNRESFSARHPVLVWCMLLLLLQAAGWALLGSWLKMLPDRANGLARPFAILIPAWLVWLLASNDWVANDRVTYWAIVILFSALAVVVSWRARAGWREWWRLQENRFAILRVEAVFWFGFFAFLGIRAANPDLWHESWGGEKPMEMTFLYGVLKSEAFPPLNPWYAGGFINYYYFGFVLCASLIKGLAVLPEVGFNLCLATFFGLACSATMSAVRALRPSGSWLPSWAATFLVMVSGNLFQLRFIWNNLVRVGSADHSLTFPLISDLIRVVYGLGRVCHGERLSAYAADLYWVSARAIGGEAVAPVTEFPFWSFLYADLHPHLIALPYTLCIIILLGAWLNNNGLKTSIGLIALLALNLGFFWPTNTWDWPTSGAVVGLTLFLSWWQRDANRPKGFSIALLKSLGWFLAAILVGYLLFLPFHTNYVAGYGSFEAWTGPRTSLRDYGFIYGLPLFILGSGAWVAGRENRIAVARSVRLWGKIGWSLCRWHHPLARYRLIRLGMTHRAGMAGALFGMSVLVLALIGVVHSALPAFLGAGLLGSALIVVQRRAEARETMPALLAFMGFGLSLLVEYVVLTGDIGRMNTVFKFYYQVWVLFGLSAALALPKVLKYMSVARRGHQYWLAAFGALIAAAALFPLTATPAKIRDRFVQTPPTLDGLAFAEEATYSMEGVSFPLAPDLRAIRWIQDNIEGSPVLLEMNTKDRLYSWGSRFAIHTGLPSVAGWSWHQRQQQAGVADNRVEERIDDVRSLYRSTDSERIRFLLRKYGVQLIVVGALERIYGTPEGLAHLAGMGFVTLYDRDDVRIYRVPSE